MVIPLGLFKSRRFFDHQLLDPCVAIILVLYFALLCREALSVGTIPIVKRSGSFDQAYDGLPVLLVDRWQDVTLELLLNTLAAWQDTPFPNLSVLSWRHWA